MKARRYRKMHTLVGAVLSRGPEESASAEVVNAALPPGSPVLQVAENAANFFADVGRITQVGPENKCSP